IITTQTKLYAGGVLLFALVAGLWGIAFDNPDAYVVRAQTEVYTASISASPASCSSPCSPNISWSSNSPNIVKIYRNGSFLWNQSPSGQATDWSLSEGTYAYTIRVVDSSWQETTDLDSVTVSVQQTFNTTLSVNAPSGGFLVGQNPTFPTYTISGAQPNTQICWTNKLNGTTVYNECTSDTTESNGSKTINGGTWTSSLIGSWNITVTVGSSSDSVSFQVKAAINPTPTPTPTPTPSPSSNPNPSFSFKINGATSCTFGTVSPNNAWTLTLTSNLLNQTVTICAVDPQGSQSCTLAGALGLQANTTAQGSWTASGSFGANDVGSWREWLLIGGIKSNEISFTIQSRTSGTGDNDVLCGAAEVNCAQQQKVCRSGQCVDGGSIAFTGSGITAAQGTQGN